MVSLCFALVRPQLKYSVQFRALQFKNDVDKLEFCVSGQIIAFMKPSLYPIHFLTYSNEKHLFISRHFKGCTQTVETQKPLSICLYWSEPCLCIWCSCHGKAVGNEPEDHGILFHPLVDSPQWLSPLTVVPCANEAVIFYKLPQSRWKEIQVLFLEGYKDSEYLLPEQGPLFNLPDDNIFYLRFIYSIFCSSTSSCM